MARQVKTIEDVIDRLGGIKEVASLTGVGITAVYAWPTRGFPPETYVVLTRALEGKGYTAPATLWQMRAVSE
jgi:hypothetical protein